MMTRLTTAAFILTITLCSPLAAQSPQFLGTLRTDTTDTEFGRYILPVGDQNGDGYTDIIVSENYRNLLFYGGDPFDSLAAMVFDHTNARNDTVGDINGDGYSDFTVHGRSEYNWRLNMYFGGPSIDTVRDLWFGLDSLTPIGFSVRGGDLNDDGRDEIVSWEGETQQALIAFELGDDSDSIPDLIIRSPRTASYPWRFGVGLTGGDFNGDGHRDLAASWTNSAQNLTNGAVYLYWGGPGFDTLPDLQIDRPGGFVEGRNDFGSVLEALGDANGDGYDDFYASAGVSSYDSLGFIYFGGPGIDDVPDVIIATRDSRARAAGDVNHDGYADLIVSYPTEWSSIGHVAIYLGGADVDSIPDVYLDVRDTPSYHHYYGLDCSGIGDFNGDGIDDFAFSTSLGGGKYVVYVYSGWDDAAGVDYDYDPVLPDRFLLRQNYPNPFNATTQIAFELPRWTHVSLNIYNLLGEQVRVLMNRELSAGTYRVEWDGRDEQDRAVASGVYLYKLTAGESEQSRKMILLK
jgi:hypothetical protein